MESILRFAHKKYHEHFKQTAYLPVCLPPPPPTHPATLYSVTYWMWCAYQGKIVKIVCFVINSTRSTLGTAAASIGFICDTRTGTALTPFHCAFAFAALSAAFLDSADLFR